jgi:hypothetical protein
MWYEVPTFKGCRVIESGQAIVQGRTDRQTDGRTDRQTAGRRHTIIRPSNDGRIKLDESERSCLMSHCVLAIALSLLDSVGECVCIL